MLPAMFSFPFFFNYFLHEFWGLSSVLCTYKTIVLLTELPAPPSAHLPFWGVVTEAKHIKKPFISPYLPECQIIREEKKN